MAERYLAKPMTSLIRISDQINHKFAHSIPLKQIRAKIPGDASLKLDYISDTNLMVQAFTSDPKLLLPDYPYEGNASLSIDITCENSCVLQLFYLNMGAEDYSESKSQKVKLKEGRQTIQLGFPKTGKMRKLRLDPGNLRGTYTIHGIQVISN